MFWTLARRFLLCHSSVLLFAARWRLQCAFAFFLLLLHRDIFVSALLTLHVWCIVESLFWHCCVGYKTARRECHCAGVRLCVYRSRGRSNQTAAVMFRTRGRLWLGASSFIYDSRVREVRTPSCSLSLPLSLDLCRSLSGRLILLLESQDMISWKAFWPPETFPHSTSLLAAQKAPAGYNLFVCSSRKLLCPFKPAAPHRERLWAATPGPSSVPQPDLRGKLVHWKIF